MARRKKEKRGFSKIVRTFTFLLVCGFPFLQVFSQATLSKVNIECERTKKEIQVQRKENDGLTMAIDELASLSKIQEVAKEEGLSYNNNNVKTISYEK